MNGFANSVSGGVAGVLVLLAAGSVAASAQDLASAGQSARAAQQPGGPLSLQPVFSGFVFTPEVKFTPVNHSTGTMVGGYGGWLLEDTFLLGGAAYWLTNGKDGTDMSYGGVIAGWMVPVGESVRVGGRGLFGFGHTEMPFQYTYANYGYGHRPAGGTTTRWAWVSQDFVVFEPQATAAIRLTRAVSFDIAGGYRMIADAGGLDRELRGGFGSVGIRFGPF